jgi:hypothetical protein
MCLVLGSAAIVIIFSIILNIFDLRDDRNELSSHKMDDHQLIKNEFKDLEALYQAGAFKFAFYLTSVKLK